MFSGRRSPSFSGFPDTPVPVVINESLEIARRYSAPESLNFLNGVLDAIARQRKSSAQLSPATREEEEYAFNCLIATTVGAPFKPGFACPGVPWGLSGIPRHSPNDSFSHWPIPHECTTLHLSSRLPRRAVGAYPDFLLHGTTSGNVCGSPQREPHGIHRSYGS